MRAAMRVRQHWRTSEPWQAVRWPAFRRTILFRGHLRVQSNYTSFVPPDIEIERLRAAQTLLEDDGCAAHSAWRRTRHGMAVAGGGRGLWLATSRAYFALKHYFAVHFSYMYRHNRPFTAIICLKSWRCHGPLNLFAFVLHTTVKWYHCIWLVLAYNWLGSWLTIVTCIVAPFLSSMTQVRFPSTGAAFWYGNNAKMLVYIDLGMRQRTPGCQNCSVVSLYSVPYNYTIVLASKSPEFIFCVWYRYTWVVL